MLNLKVFQLFFCVILELFIRKDPYIFVSSVSGYFLIPQMLLTFNSHLLPPYHNRSKLYHFSYQKELLTFHPLPLWKLSNTYTADPVFLKKALLAVIFQS